MKSKTEELLHLLLWSADRLVRPTFRNLTDSYEAWAFREGWSRRITALTRQQLIEPDPNYPKDRLYRLTERGRLQALGGRDPLAQWSRPWDGKWRLVLFDVPQSQSTQRTKLRRYLRGKSYGYLQNSVWVTPDSMQVERVMLGDGQIDVESLLLLEARPCAGESDADIVNGAWDFERINRLYVRHLKVLEERPVRSLQTSEAAKAFQRWAIEERATWLEAVCSDPLLPERLLPSGYLGQRAWQRRVGTLELAAQQLQTFRN